MDFNKKHLKDIKKDIKKELNKDEINITNIFKPCGDYTKLKLVLETGVWKKK